MGTSVNCKLQREESIMAELKAHQSNGDIKEVVNTCFGASDEEVSLCTNGGLQVARPNAIDAPPMDHNDNLTKPDFPDDYETPKRPRDVRKAASARRYCQVH